MCHWWKISYHVLCSFSFVTVFTLPFFKLHATSLLEHCYSGSWCWIPRYIVILEIFILLHVAVSVVTLRQEFCYTVMQHGVYCYTVTRNLWHCYTMQRFFFGTSCHDVGNVTKDKGGKVGEGKREEGKGKERKKTGWGGGAKRWLLWRI